MTLRIFNLGRMKKSAQIVVGDNLDADGVSDEIYRAVLRMKGLGSRGIDIDWNHDERRGVILVGGFRPVGEVEEVSP